MYILDKDPYDSARFLIKLHVIKYIKDLEYTFAHYNSAYKENLHNHMLIKSVIYSVDNYIWFSKFYEHLRELYSTFEMNGLSKNAHFSTEFLYDINNKNFKNIGILLPCAMDSMDKKLKRYNYQRYIKDITNTIDINRVMYILNNYKLKSFTTKVPSWYQPLSDAVYTNFNRKDKKKVKILNDGNNNYTYFISTISDKWVKVENVPKEIKLFVDTLLYN